MILARSLDSLSGKAGLRDGGEHVEAVDYSGIGQDVGIAELAPRKGDRSVDIVLALRPFGYELAVSCAQAKI